MYQGKRIGGDAQQPRDYQPRRLNSAGKAPLIKLRGHMSAGATVRCAAAGTALCVLAFTGAVELTAAYLHDQDRLNNRFVLGSVTPSVVETFEPENRLKKDVSVKNDGNTPVYIRALLVITWKDAQGRSILTQPPQPGTDYTLTGPASDSGWTLGGDGYYYYTRPVDPKQSTAKLIETLEDKNTDAARRLSVDVIAQAVQASPTQAVTEAFQGAGVAPDGTLTPPVSEVAP